MASVRPEDWVKIGEEKLASAATSIRVPASGSFAEYNSLLVLVDAQADGADQSPALTFNDETTGTKYSTVYTHDSGQTSSITRQNDQAKITNMWSESGGLPSFAHLHILNNSGNEKSVIFNGASQSTAGSTNFPPLTSGVGKWEEITNRITSLRLTNNSSGTPNFGVGTEVIVFGSHKATNAADKSIITNVPAGSRYEETDTRKIYNYNSTTVNTDGDITIDNSYTVNAEANKTAGGYQFGTGHTLIGKTIKTVKISLRQSNGVSNTTGTSSVYCGTTSDKTIIGVLNNSALPAYVNNTTEKTYATFTGTGTRVLAVDEWIWFENNGVDGSNSSADLFMARWDSQSSNTLWNDDGATVSGHRDTTTASEDGTVPGASAKPIRMEVITTDEWVERVTS